MIDRPFVAFAGSTRIASGTKTEAALAAKHALTRDPTLSLLVFARETGRVVDLDLRGTDQDIIERYAPPAPSSPVRGRPKLGVVAREVTLLPRHWDWLARQSGGASVVLRKLVEAALKEDGDHTRGRERNEAAYRFMAAIAGNFPGFEEAARALFANDRDGFAAIISQWPIDVRDEVARFL